MANRYLKIIGGRLKIYSFTVHEDHVKFYGLPESWNMFEKRYRYSYIGRSERSYPWEIHEVPLHKVNIINDL